MLSLYKWTIVSSTRTGNDLRNWTV
jgi:hypothetical protein